MAVLPVRVWPDPVLTRKADPVDAVDAEVVRLLADMAETMYKADGIGLAAPQVGVSRRVITIDVPGSEGEPGSGLIYAVNPRVVSREGACTMTEGCLSFPGLEIDVKRAERVRVEYLDQHGQPQVVDADGVLAICFQHEIDHLDGIVFTERLGPVRRRLALRDFDKLRRAEAGR
jgi:peptide deformylase